ncbi:focadhesin-like [Teleopsis dalmanni]|uniref:focadhesin-like n=1 Tax=Teleopsis dalmanni TaxID=139649 RepID=UPI0018CCE8AF|nr:focadhesin-like [Teleopsis dalmanni]
MDILDYLIWIQTQYIIITESIDSLLMLTLKRKAANLKKDEVYKSQFGLKIQQHPFIILLQNPSVNMNDIGNKIKMICTHHDSQIRDMSIEYLRPVFLYILCNSQNLSDSKTIWTILLSLCKTNRDAHALVLEVLSWSKLCSTATCLFTSILLTEAIDYFLSIKDISLSVDLCIYQALVVNILMKYGIDPRPSLNSLLRVLHSAREHTQHHYNVLLILFADGLHILSPFYLPELLRNIAFIVVQENCGNQYILNMCLDGIIQWMSQTAFIPPEGMTLAHQIIKKILSLSNNTSSYESPTRTKELKPAQIRYFHTDIAIAFDLANLVESFDESEFKDVFNFVDTLNVKSNTAFCERLHLFLRALFLSHEPSIDCWFKIYESLLEIIKINSNIAYDFLMTYIFKLAHEHNPEVQLELLRGLPGFAVSKDNVPMILSTIRKLTTENASFCLDLYMRLWRVDPRTYTFLCKLLSLPNKNKDWEFIVTRTNTIKEICNEKPTQHGADFVGILSETLTSNSDEAGDLPTSLALDAITLLCTNDVINITSAWNVLSNKFRHETRPRSLRSLFRFFARIPSLQTPTDDYEKLVDEALEQLWKTISHPDSKSDLVKEAFSALKDYDPSSMLTLRHIPIQYRQHIRAVQEYIGSSGREVVDLQRDRIPGECWVQVLQQMRPDCGGAVADLIAHFIYNEINEYRSGVYRLPEGKPEPRKLTQLTKHSPLREIINYLVHQAQLGDHITEPHVVTNALRAISKKFPKPIPPIDWSFLYSFFHISFDTRKYCILIATNQVLYSGTARRLLENFLLDFEPNCFEEDLLLLFSLLPDISGGVSLQITKNFAEKVSVYCFKESQLNGFVEGCLFEKFLDSVKYIYSKCDLPEVLDVYTLIVERHMDSMDLDSRLFERYTEVVSCLPVVTIDGLTSPANWWETPIGKLKKATIIRCYLVLYNSKLANQLHWLTTIIDAFATKREEHHFLFRHLAATLYAFNSDEQSSSWVMELLLQIQNLLAESSNKEKLEKALFIIDVLILTVDVLSGCGVLLGNLDIVATTYKARNEIFPESLQLLCDHVFFKDQEVKIYEFVYNLYKNPAIPDSYATIFKDAIICSRNKTYFETKSIWTKYVGMRR